MYKRYSQARFFDKFGSPINLQYDEDREIWTGNIHFEEVSIKLFENITIFILEEFENNVGDVLYGTPHIDQAATSDSITATLAVGSSSAFKLFTVDNPYNPRPFITIEDEIDVEVLNVPSDTYNSTTKRLVTSVNETNAIRFDIAISSDEDGVYERRLVLSDSEGTIAEIELYGEVVGEEERFNNLLSIFGETISEREEFIFRQSDINEDLPNYKILNHKRKELLIELHNIQPYLSSIKGIVNIIKFFGYFDLKIKEYWKNVETGVLYLEDVHTDGFTDLSVRNQLKEYPFQKTSYFGLFYDINHVLDEYNDLGLPVTEVSTTFSNEEIIIKLFGLKNYIKDRQIGGVSEIIDIIGEATFFAKYDINYWTDQSQLFSYNINITPSFTVDKQLGYIQDIRPIINEYSGCVLPETVSADLTPTIQFGNYPNCFIGFFDPLLMPDPQLLDEPEIPVGMPIALENHTFDLPWSEVNMTWANTAYQSINVTWETISHLNYYEIEWVVTRVVTVDDPRPFVFSQRGTISDLESINVNLPYTGFYDVALIVYGWNNETSKHTEKRFIEVKVKEADFVSFFRYHDKNLQIWSGNYLTWETCHSEWENTIFDNENFLVSQNEIQTRSFNVLNFLNLNSFNLPNVGTRTPTWDQFPDNIWTDYEFQTYETLVHQHERLARFIIESVAANGEIQVGVDSFILPSNINIHDYQVVADLLTAETGDDISTFYYTARTLNPLASATFIDCVSRIYGYDGDRYVGSSGGVVISDVDANLLTWENVQRWDDIPLSWDHMQYALRTNAQENPFSYDNVEIYNNRFDVPVMIPVFIVVDNSKMAGKTQARWIITNEDTGEILADIDSLFMAYRFDRAGYYSIEVTITDTNGNQNSIKKEKHVRVMDVNQFRNKIATIHNLNVPA